MRQRRAFGWIRKLPSGRHQASYVGPDGGRHLAPTTFLVRSDAEAWLRDEDLLIDRREWTPPATRPWYDDDPSPLLRDYAEATISRRERRARKPLRPSTAALYRKLLRLSILDALGDLRLSAITPEAITQWHDGLPPDNPTQNGNAYLLLRSLLAEAVDAGLIDRNPCRIKGAGKPTPKHQAVALTPAELRAYLEAVPDLRRLPLALTVWGSLRSGEVRALRRCDALDGGAAISVEQTVSRLYVDGKRKWVYGPPKTAAGRRTIALPDALADGLRAYLETWDAEHPGATGGDLLFPARDGVSPLNGSVLRKAHKVGARAVGRPEMTVHDLRKTGATLAGQSGATIKELMRRLGHTTAGVAMIYQVADDERDRELARRMGALT